MILLDTTVLVYAVGADHPLRVPCRQLLELGREGRVRPTTTLEVIQEFAHVRARRGTRSDAAAVARSYAQALGPLVRLEVDDLVDGLEIFENVPALASFDAVLAAAARRRGWPLVSADRAYAGLDGVVHLNPASGTFVEDVLAAG